MLELLTHANEPHKAQHKDKLAETKKRDSVIHDALKVQQHQQKEIKDQKHRDDAREFKANRQYNLEQDPEGKHNKRAVKEQRELLKHAEKAATGTMCEHGVQRCKICFPPRSEVAKHHEHERGPALGADIEEAADE